ncbi:hypothetical protein [Sporosarcina sp. FSL K6-1508]|uniref:hypothetical protein n=1 Tax=Sporosarcina sp. FSL K6-1508 TaxID=2921553 RepID=UPI0030FC942B
MFENDIDFNQALLVALKGIHDEPEDIDFWHNDLSGLAFTEVLKHALNFRLATGFTLLVGADEGLTVSFQDPKLTNEGLWYLEDR